MPSGHCNGYIKHQLLSFIRVLSEVLAAFAYSYQIYASKNQYHGKTFDKIKSVHAQIDGDYTCHYRLNIIIHARNSGAKRFLPYHDKHITEKRGTHNDICNAANHRN